MHLPDNCCTAGRILEALNNRSIDHNKEDFSAKPLLQPQPWLLESFSCRDLLWKVYRREDTDEQMTFFELVDTLLTPHVSEEATTLRKWFFQWRCPEHDNPVCLTNVISCRLPSNGNLLNLYDVYLSCSEISSFSSMLFNAAAHKNTELMVLLFKTKYSENNNKWMAMNAYTEEGEDRTWIGVLIKELSVEHFQTLVSAGYMDTAMQHPLGNTAFHQAVRCSNYEILERLVRRCLELSQQNDSFTYPRNLYSELLELSTKKSPTCLDEFCRFLKEEWPMIDLEHKWRILKVAVEKEEEDFVTFALSENGADFAAKDRALGSSFSLMYLAAEKKLFKAVAKIISTKFSHQRPESLEAGTMFWDLIDPSYQRIVREAALRDEDVRTEEKKVKRFLEVAEEGDELLFGAFALKYPTLRSYVGQDAQNVAFHCHPNQLPFVLRQCDKKYIWRRDRFKNVFLHTQGDVSQLVRRGLFDNAGTDTANILLYGAIADKLEVVTEALKRGCIYPSLKDADGKAAIHYLVEHLNCERNYQAIEIRSKFMEKFLSDKQVDIDALDPKGRPALHVINVDLEGVIRAFLDHGANFWNLKDKAGKTFISSSHRAKSRVIEWLGATSEDKIIRLASHEKNEVLTSISGALDDEVLVSLLRRLRDIIRNENNEEMDQEWILSGNGHALLKNLWKQRQSDKAVLNNSYRVMTALLAEVHRDKDRDKLKSHCYKNFDITMRKSIFESVEDELEREMDLGFLAMEAVKSGFFVIILLGLFDFASDIFLTIEYFRWDPGKSDHPFNSSECSDHNSRSLFCSYKDIPTMEPLAYCTIFLLLPYVLHIFLVSLRESAKQYLAKLSGNCCILSPKAKSVPRKVQGHVLAVVLQPMGTQFWQFICERRFQLQLSNISKLTTHATDMHHPKENQLSHSGCLIFDEDTGARRDMRRLAENAAFLGSKTKMIIACTEDSWMPLLQLGLSFPHLTASLNALLQQEDSKGWCDNIDDCLAKLSNNWQFYLTIFSVTSSIMSLAVTHTLFYFSKPSKVEQKSPIRFMIYLAYALFSCVARLLALLMLAYGSASAVEGRVSIVFIWTLTGFCHIFIVGLILSVNTLLSGKKFDYHECLKIGYSAMSSLYIFTEVEFDEARASFWKDEPKDEEKVDLLQNDAHEEPEEKQSPRYFSLHVIMDFLLLIENVAFALIGYLSINESLVVRAIFLGGIIGSQVVGVTFKATFYRVLHPWASLRKGHSSMLAVLVLFWVAILGVVTQYLMVQFVPMRFNIAVWSYCTMFIVAAFLIKRDQA